MAVPKKKMSRMRTRHRRAQWKIRQPPQAICSRCQARVLPHRACAQCGTYRGRQILEVE